MSLNKQKGNMYGFVTHTWNTVKGKCPHNCSYCYMKRFPQPELHFDENELNTNLGEGNFIFVGSSCDMFANSIPKDWILRTIELCDIYSKNQYIFQSKNPKRFKEFLPYFPKSSVLCTTIETNREKEYQYLSGGQSFGMRAEEFLYLSEAYPLMITIEPIMDFDIDDLQYWFELIGDIKQINIGADSGNNHLPEPPKEKILELISELEKFTVVYQKSNLKRLLK